MAAGYAARALHRQHLGPWTWVLWGAYAVLGACQPKLGSLVGRSQRGDAGRAWESEGGARQVLDAGRDAGDASSSVAVGSLEGGAPDASTSDAARGAVSRSGEGAESVDAAVDAAMSGDAGPHDAAWVSSQAWPFANAAAYDAGASLSVGSATAVVVDGDISDWPRVGWTTLTHRVPFAESPDSVSEFTAATAWQRAGDELFLAVVVRDDLHDNTHGGFDIWKGDSLQVAFDVGQERLPYDWEYGVALVSDVVQVHRWLSSDAALGGKFPAAVARWGDVTVYELCFEPARLGLSSFDDAALRVSVAVNESDGEERTVALELAPGIVEPSKSKAQFVVLSW